MISLDFMYYNVYTNTHIDFSSQTEYSFFLPILSWKYFLLLD